MASRSHPVAGVATGVSRKGGGVRVQPATPYRRALARAGGRSVLLWPGMPKRKLAEAWRRIDRLLLTGGGDVDPRRYGARRHPKTGMVSAARDAFEARLIRRALGEGMPVLAICRGIQILNVVLGGTLVQDIPSMRGKRLVHSRGKSRPPAMHRIRILRPGTLLESVTGARSLRVNSFHHQAVGLPAPGLRVIARSPDGIVEAVEPAEHRGFLVAIQWHPEKMPARDPLSRRLFRAFLRACPAR